MTYAELLVEAQALAANNVTLIRRIALGPAERLQSAADAGARVTRGELLTVQRLAEQVAAAEARAERRIPDESPSGDEASGTASATSRTERYTRAAASPAG